MNDERFKRTALVRALTCAHTGLLSLPQVVSGETAQPTIASQNCWEIRDVTAASEPQFKRKYQKLTVFAGNVSEKRKGLGARRKEKVYQR